MKNIKKILAIALAVISVLTLFTACSPSPEKKLIGSWRDSTGLAGYEFKEDGKCVVTFADIKFLNFNGSVDGVYTTEKREDGKYYVTITYTIYAKSVTKDFMFTVEESSLTLVDTVENTTTVLIAHTPDEKSTVATTVAPTVAG